MFPVVCDFFIYLFVIPFIDVRWLISRNTVKKIQRLLRETVRVRV